MAPLRELVEELIALDGREVLILRPREADQFIDEEAFDTDEYMPYWAELWPSALALARIVAGRSLRGARTLELGCGLGLVSIAAALAGARVLATDWAPDALEVTARNAARNGVTLETERCDWAHPDPIVRGAPWDLVLASDVLYEERYLKLIPGLLPRLVEDGEVWLAEPGRAVAAGFRERVERDFLVSTSEHRTGGVTVAVHRLRRRSQ
jgi:predicted nicotinamide N-methyase